MESFLWKKAKTFQRKVKFFPICLFCMCFKTSDLCSLMTDESNSRTRDHKLTYVSCSEGRERSRDRGGGSSMQDAQGQRVQREGERGQAERNPCQAHLHNLRAGVPRQGLLHRMDDWDLHYCVQFPITDGSHKILARWQQQKKKEKHLTRSLRVNFCPELKQTLPTRRRKSPGPQLALQRKSLGSTLQK